MTTTKDGWMSVVSIRMPAEMRAAAEALAGETKTISQIVREAVKEYAAWRGHPVQ